MQTFLPSPDYRYCAEVLDRARLGKQRIENLQIMAALLGVSEGYKNHPAVLMWRGCERGLWLYHDMICFEWVARGYNDTCIQRMAALVHDRRLGENLPAWASAVGFHASHRSNLLRKAPEHYRQFWPTEPDDLEYVWPIRSKDLK